MVTGSALSPRSARLALESVRALLPGIDMQVQLQMLDWKEYQGM